MADSINTINNINEAIDEAKRQYWAAERAWMAAGAEHVSTVQMVAAQALRSIVNYNFSKFTDSRRLARQVCKIINTGSHSLCQQFISDLLRDYDLIPIEINLLHSAGDLIAYKKYEVEQAGRNMEAADDRWAALMRD